MKSILPTLLFIFVLNACSSIPQKPLLNAPIVTVSEQQLDNYWISQNQSSRVQPSRSQQQILIKVDVYAYVSFIIDSNGNVYEINVLETNYEGKFETLIASTLQRREFVPAKTNSARVPVKVRARLDFARKS